MIQVMQTKDGPYNGPREERGNCFAACLASILEVDISDVPDAVMDDDSTDEWSDWQISQNLYFCDLTFDRRRSEPFPPGYAIAVVDGGAESDDGTALYHAVVFLDGEITHDPSPNPAPDGYTARDVELWVVVAPLDPAKPIKTAVSA